MLKKQEISFKFIKKNAVELMFDLHFQK